MKLLDDLGDFDFDAGFFGECQTKLNVFADEIDREAIVVVAGFENTIDVVLQKVRLGWRSTKRFLNDAQIETEFRADGENLGSARGVNEPQQVQQHFDAVTRAVCARIINLLGQTPEAAK